MHLKGVVVDKILLFSAPPFSAIANVAALVLVSAMSVKLIVAIEALSAEATFRMSLEATLVDSSRIIIPKFAVST